MLASRRALNAAAASPPGRPAADAILFGRRYWWIVGAEIALLGGGLGLLALAGAPAQTDLAWIALAAGLRFFAFRLTGVWSGGIVVTASLLVLLGASGLRWQKALRRHASRS